MSSQTLSCIFLSEIARNQGKMVNPSFVTVPGHAHDAQNSPLGKHDQSSRHTRSKKHWYCQEALRKKLTAVQISDTLDSVRIGHPSQNGKMSQWVGVSMAMRLPPHAWFTIENPMKMDDLGGTPISGYLHVSRQLSYGYIHKHKHIHIHIHIHIYI